jgi:hypothetical protein
MMNRNVYLPLGQILVAGSRSGTKSFWDPTLFAFKLIRLLCRR